MAFDSLIRLRQLNTAELSGYISQVLFPALRASGFIVSGNDFYPANSGASDLGLPSKSWDNIYANNLNVPSGSGIFFGPTFVTAYESGVMGVIRVGDYTITSSAQGISVIGPTGPTGPTGVSGAIGQTGIGVTGAVNQNNYLRLLFSDGTSGNLVQLPSGATGVSGIGVTGFANSGINYIVPLLSNGTSGNPVYAPSGATGPQGIAGGILIDTNDLTGILTGQTAPNVTIYNIDPLTTDNPSLHFIRGMRYTIGQSGLGLSPVTVVGHPTIPDGTYQSNFFVDENGITGYMRFCVWSTSADDSSYTGRLIYPETSLDYSSLTSKIKDAYVMTNIEEDIYKRSLSFNVQFGAEDSYKYGFARYAMDGTLFDGVSEENLGGYVLGDLTIGYFGPTGPTGLQGERGLDGPQGEPGPAGGNGTAGVGITGVYRNPLDGTQIRFLLSDGTYTDYVEMPAGGATGPTGPQGEEGPVGSGATGPTGPQGVADTYSCSFYSNEINATSGATPSFNKQTSGTSNWVYCTGNDMRFTPGDAIWFQHDTLRNKAYSTWQKLIFADNNYTGTRYFYASVQSFNSTAGEIKATIDGSPYPPVGTSGGYTYWNQYNLVDLNLGGLGSDGPTGPTGPQGIPGDTGNAIFNISASTLLTSHGTTTLDCVDHNAWDLYFTDDANNIAFDTSRFSTGETVQLKITNNSLKRNDEYSLITWDSFVKFPYNISAPAPNPGETAIYTFVRWNDVASVPMVYCTYSLRYN